jgi:hypothetical protein
MGLHTALNLHPASGVYPHEVQYIDMAEAVGLDPATEDPVPFNIADKEFTEAYFDLLHHPMERMGVDFWWLDWQQGTQTNLAGLDPLFWLNHLHFYDLARDGVKRPFIFSRWGGLGSQRYPIGFSGDTIISWETLHFQPYFTATAANVGYGWWSHDIGGHMGGVEEPELYLRWVQLGVFSPIMRLHSTNNPFHERRPWGFDAETEIHAAEAMRLRHALIPYLYTAAWRNWQDGILPIRPLYHLHPDVNAAYLCPNEYTFGSELLAVPFTSKRDEDTRMSRQVVWLPDGEWFDFFGAKRYEGGGWHAIYGDLGDVPVFAKAGAIVPMGPIAGWDNVDPPNTIELRIFPGADNVFTLYEDDGQTMIYKKGVFTLTTFRLVWEEKEVKFFIDPREGPWDDGPAERKYRLRFYALNAPEKVDTNLAGETVQVDWNYDQDSHILTIETLELPVTSGFELNITPAEGLQYCEDEREATFKRMLRVFKMNSFVKQSLDSRLDELLTNPMILIEYADRMEKSHLLAFIETWLGVQNEPISLNPEEAFNRIINRIYGH